MPLADKKIVLIVSGGIAAYKINYLVRGLVKKGSEVRVVLTPSARNFVSELTLSTLSKNPVLSEFYDAQGVWNNHVEIALWADAIVVAPCTANTLSKMVHGGCDNLALAVYMSAKCQVFIAPAMDLDMYSHPSTAQNIEIAESYGHSIIPAQYGELASGLIGQGRLEEPEKIIEHLESFFLRPRLVMDLAGKKVLITAGPTYEAIDPVRFIGNHSSGKMGFALARQAASRGAQVVLISGPTVLELEHPHVKVISVSSAREMQSEVFKYYDSVQIAIASAAVADYAPKVVADEKIKKSEDTMLIELVKNPDILMEMGQKKKEQFLVGFALETQDEVKNAQSKLVRKNLDLIVLNSLRDQGAGFKEDTNKIRLLSGDKQIEFDLKSKDEVAKDIFDFILTRLPS